MTLLRFAPSPTGPLHLGGLRMALYNYLYARKHGGKWIMRIEDTDATRTVPGAVDGIRGALEWAGLEYDYGPGKDGPHRPYYQSERLDLYRSYAKKLLDSGKAYRCFCSVDKLSEIRERLARLGSNASYDKTCLHLSDEEVARKVRAGEKHVVRINDSIRPERGPTSDIIFGHVKDAHASLATDPVLLKSDLFPTYHLACVVDDHEMEITHVLRGEEWLPSLPLHLDLFAHLNLKPPQYAHFPVLLNPDGTKMSKRNGDVQVIDYIRRGWGPDAILNWIGLAGWGAQHEETYLPPSSTTDGHVQGRLVHEAPESTKIMSLSEMVSNFELSAMTQRSSSLDPTKLEYISKHHLMRAYSTPAGLEGLARRVHSRVKEAFPASQYTDPEHIEKVILTLDGRLTNIYDIPTFAPYFFVEPDLTTEEAKQMSDKVPPELRERILTSAVAVLRAHADSSGWLPGSDLLGLLVGERHRLRVSQRHFMTAVRHALTGMKDGPAVADIMRVLGPERTLARLR